MGGSSLKSFEFALMRLAFKGEKFLGKQEEKEIEAEPKIRLGEQQKS